MDSVKTLENPFQLRLGNTGAAILDMNFGKPAIARDRSDFDIYFAARVFDGIVDEVRDRGANLIRIAQNRKSGCGVICQ
jgi:hypothetical protein